MEESIAFVGKGPAEILKWKVRKGSEIQRGSILCLYKTENTDITSKLKATKGGTVLSCLVEEGTSVQEGEELIRLQGCSHATVMKDLCALCGANLRNASGKPGDRIENVSASVAMVHSVPELIVSEEEAKRIGREDESRLLRDRKLVLLVDLDQTLLHTTNDQIPANLKDVHHFQMWHGPALMWYHTKFRPATERFLSRVSKMYELHICTFGVRVYAHIIAKLLDPEGQYFSHRILSRDECFNPTSKTANLKALFPCGDSMVAIIDDREDVWNFSPNLIHVKPYQFFCGTADINAPPGLERNTDGQSPDFKRRKSRVIRVPKQKNNTKKDESIKAKTDNTVNNEMDTDKTKDNEKKLTENQTDQEKGESPIANDKSALDSKIKEPEENNSQEESLKVQSKQTKTEENSLSNPLESTKGEKDKSKTEMSNEETDKILEDSSQVKEHPKEVQETPDEIDDLAVSSSDEEDDNDKSVAKEQASEVSKIAATADTLNEKVDSSDDPKVNAGSDVNDTSEKTANPDVNLEKIENIDPKKDAADATKQADECCPKDETEYEELIEWEDDDDYLLYLEEILTRIHTAFYECYDQTKNRDSNVELPSLKKIIPYVHKKVLKGTNIVFSGVFPTNMPAEKSRAYIVAQALGANIQTAFVGPEDNGGDKVTTHVVAARPGTQKVRQARKYKKVHIVSAEWLWTCADRWERVDERLYPLQEDPLNSSPRNSPKPSQSKQKKRKSDEEATLGDSDTAKNSQKQAKMARLEEDGTKAVEKTSEEDGVTEPQPSTSEGVPARLTERRFSESYNPMLAFSRADIDDMDKEVEDILEASDSDDNDDEEKAEKQAQLLRKKVLKAAQDSSSDESLSGDFPRGWKKKYRKNASPKNASPETKDNLEVEDEPVEEEVPDQPHRILRHSSDSDSEEESDKESFDDSIGSADDEMAAAVEKEFLNF